MHSMQQRTLNAIANALTLAGLQTAQQQVWANTGSVYAYQQHNNMLPCIVIAYNFQAVNYKQTLTAHGTQIASQPGRSGYYDFYQQYTQPTRFWWCLYTVLNAPAITRTLNAAARKQLRALLKQQQQYATYNSANARCW